MYFIRIWDYKIIKFFFRCSMFFFDGRKVEIGILFNVFLCIFGRWLLDIWFLKVIRLN